MIEEVDTGHAINTEVRPIESGDFQSLGSEWRFDWRISVESMEVFKLVDPTNSEAILGLLARRRHDRYVEVSLLESQPRSVGRAKRFRGIPGSLLAFAAQLSFELGGEGFLVIDAKTELLEHYHRTYGFERVGQSQRMVLATGAAARLISAYGGRLGHG